MIVAANQPYLFPYLGYFQLIAGADLFVAYDSMQYVSRSWINRNRLLIQGKDRLITSPVEKANRFSPINQRFYVDKFLQPWMNTLKFNYARAPHFHAVMKLMETLANIPTRNVAEFNIMSIKAICQYIGVQTPLVKLSEMLKFETEDKCEKTIAVVNSCGGDTYINLPGGRTLYDQEYFNNHNIKLLFLNPALTTYSQHGVQDFHSALSILDVMMNCSTTEIRRMIDNATFTD